jgi:phosphoribosylformylglycinamidine synthase PurS subunit
MSWKVHVRILPRAGLLDPQGQAVEHALAALRFPDASNVHVGKAIALEVAAPTAAEAESRVRSMCERLLANPVTEQYEIEVESGGPG